MRPKLSLKVEQGTKERVGWGRNIPGKLTRRHRGEDTPGMSVGSHRHPPCGKEGWEKRLLMQPGVSDAELKAPGPCTPGALGAVKGLSQGKD